MEKQNFIKSVKWSAKRFDDHTVGNVYYKDNKYTIWTKLPIAYIIQLFGKDAVNSLSDSSYFQFEFSKDFGRAWFFKGKVKKNIIVAAL